jgi:hypothetical protein
MKQELFKLADVVLIKNLILNHVDNSYSILLDLFKLNYKTTDVHQLDKLINTVQEYKLSLEIINILDKKEHQLLEKPHLKIILDVVSLFTTDTMENLMIELSTQQQNQVCKLVDLSVVQNIVEEKLAEF